MNSLGILRNKRVLITGATGFIGVNLVRAALKENADVYIFTRSTSDKWRLKGALKHVSERRVELLNYRIVKKNVLNIRPEIIFHTAAYGGYPGEEDADKTVQINITGTMNLVNACAGRGFISFINTGTSSEYGAKSRPMREMDLPEPNSLYGVAKAAASAFCRMRAARDRLPITTLRLFSPYGYYEGGERLVPSCIMAALNGKDPRLSSAGSVRDFIFVEDVVEAYLKAASRGGRIAGEIINIGSGRQHSVGEVVKKIIRLTGNKAAPRWGALKNPRQEPRMWQADISRAKEMLKWEPRYSLTEGLEITIDWFKRSFKLYEKR